MNSTSVLDATLQKLNRLNFISGQKCPLYSIGTYKMGILKSLGADGCGKFRFEFIADKLSDKKWTKGAELGLEDGKTFK